MLIMSHLEQSFYRCLVWKVQTGDRSESGTPKANLTFVYMSGYDTETKHCHGISHNYFALKYPHVVFVSIYPNAVMLL